MKAIGVDSSADATNAILKSPWYMAIGFVGAITGAYHGYKRTGSAGWAFGWMLFGSAMPFFSIPLSLAEGFGQPKKAKMNRRRRRRQ